MSARPHLHAHALTPVGTIFLVFLVLACALAFSACAPEIGDECETALDCSSAGTRLCDRTQPHGYCTIQGCEQGTCPEEAVCVEFRPDVDCLTTTYCMFKCDDNGECRDDQGYACMSSAAFSKNAVGVDAPNAEAKVLDGSSKKFCAYRLPAPVALPDAGALMSIDDDAGTP